MRLKNSYFYTLRENVKDEESISGNLLVRSGMIRKTSSGIYMMLPMGYKVVENIKKIIRKEMNAAGAQELQMPLLINEEHFIKTGRLSNFGKEMFKVKDRYNKPYALGPTHEELFTMAASYKINSYKDMPFNLYQIGTKFRDEMRPRFGLVRVREFTMKDAYSFDINEEKCDVSYNIMKDVYINILNKCKLDYKIVTSDTGTMGGSLSEEFQAITSVGEDDIVSCSCGYSSNIDVATCYLEDKKDEKQLKKEEMNTPNCNTIEDVCKYLKIDVKNSIKALLMKINDELIIFFIRGDRELNEDKVKKIFNVKEVLFANDELINKSNAVPGFTGPIDVKAKVVIDKEVLNMKNFCCGANKLDYHYINVNIDDFKYDMVEDIVKVKKGDLCPLCKKELEFDKGIEVANIFKLGTKYSESYNLTYLDKNNNSHNVVMGCYGIGIDRIMASIVEQHHDDNGIVWPLVIAPYKVGIVLLDNDKECVKAAEDLYNALTQLELDPILDDRGERAGVKFKDMDLIGVPIKITIGKKIHEGLYEYKLRTSDEVKLLNINELKEEIKSVKI